MNKNEKEQFALLKDFIEQGKDDNDDIFYGAINVESTNMNAYDAIVTFSNHKKYVQITTMSNVVLLSKDGKIHHANKYDSLKGNFSDEKQINCFEKMGIKRKIIRDDGNSIFFLDKFAVLTSNEEDLDKKHQIKSLWLINAICRALKIKLNKYGLSDKRNTSVLVIIDESLNIFIWRSTINFKKLTNTQKNKIKKEIFYNYFNKILYKALKESYFDKNNFFDEIQVYFKNAQTQDYYFSNNILSSNVKISEDKIGMGEILPFTMNDRKAILWKRWK